MSPLPGTTDSFNEPPTDDNTSAPPMPQVPTPASPKPKKQKKQRDPGPLARMIARSKRASQSGYKYG